MAGIGNLQSLLASAKISHLINNTGEKIDVEFLKEKIVLLYVAHKTAKEPEKSLSELVEAYEKIKAQDPAFEIVYVCSDPDNYSYEEFFSPMPWLAVPKRELGGKSLAGKFVVPGMNNRLLAYGRDGQMLTEDAYEYVTLFGAAAHPFTEEHLRKLHEKWPSKLQCLRLHSRHPLELTRSEQLYECAVCHEKFRGWSYCCKECSYFVHLHCIFCGKEGWTKFEEKKMNQTGAGSSKTE